MVSIVDLVVKGNLCSLKGLPERVGEDILSLFTEIYGDQKLMDKIKDFPVYRVVDNYGLECRAYLGSRDSSGDVVLPVGFVSQVEEYLGRLGYKCNKIRCSDYPLPDVDGMVLAPHLRPYQKDAVIEALRHMVGIVQLPTGAGKTEINIEIIRQCPAGFNKLILVPTKDLLHQTVNAISRRLGIEVGVIGDGKFELREVSVAIPNTIDIRLKEGCPTTLAYCKSLYALLVDECHDVISEPRVWRMLTLMESKVITLGFSATPWLERGLGRVMDGLLGQPIVEGKVSEFMGAGVIETPIIKYYVVPKPPVPPALITRLGNAKSKGGYSMALMNTLYNVCIVNHKTRNKLIVKLVKERMAVDEGPIALVVSRVGTSSTKGSKKVVSHSDILQTLIKEELGIEFPLLHGGTSSKESKSIVKQLLNKEIKGVIAGPAALTNGLDIPCLNAIFLCGGGKKLSDVLQRVGRVLRVSGNETRPLVVDFYDNVLYFKGHSDGRIKVCKDTYGPKNVEIVDISVGT